MEINNTPKNADIYVCDKCNFKCSKKCDWTRHVTTRKHNMEIIGNNWKSKNAECIHCCKIFKSVSGLWKHRKKCNQEINTSTLKSSSNNNNAPDMNVVMVLLKQNQDFKELMIGQSKQIQEQQEENQELQKQLLYAVKDQNISYNTTHNNTVTNNNQKFNLNFFLNTTCKDAMNMSEFIENIEIDFKDIENIGRNGYISGMTDMILSRIQELDVTKRPLHCTDLKRETMYIKDNDEWTKDTPENSKLHKTIKYVAKRNYATIPLWREKHPECQDWNNPQYDFCVDMMRNILGDIGNEQIRLDNKVIKNLSRHILVDKT
jgi:hypothetical protein